ncbi:MAG TPA: hypothetical protein VM509_09140, partial [Planctomycetota bacterium]|nr:hypothetical protein [Planctomycetota bacterium]
VRTAQPNLCVFDVGHTEADADRRRLLDLAEIARKAGIAPTELDVGTVMIKTQELPALLSAFPHYEMCLLDFPDWIDPDAAYEAVIAAAVEAGNRSGVVLGRARDSTLFIHSNDDCYLEVEAREQSRVLEYFARLLQEFVSARFGLPGQSVGLPMQALLVEVLSKSGVCTMFDIHAREEGGRLWLGYSTQAYRLGNEAADPEACLIYDKEKATWSAE